jgi:hypothetical protein
MKIKPQTAFIITLLIFVLGIATTSAMGLFNTKSAKIRGKIDTAGYTDSYDPGGIKGSYTFSDISNLYNVPLEDLSVAFGFSDASMKVSQLKTIYEVSSVEIGPASVKLFVAYYLGLPYEPAEEAWLPGKAAELLLNKGILTAEQTDYVQTHALDD